MTFQFKYHFSAILLTALVGRVIWMEFDRRESNLRAGQNQLLAAQQTTWAQEDAQRALAARQKSLEMEKAHAQEKIKALGGPFGATAKDAALDIRQMLTQFAIAAAPTGTEVSVTVDRFTEFDAAMELHQPLSSRQLAAMTKAFLKNGAPYVHSLRFIQDNEVLAQLDETAVESITNWNTASVDSIQALLSAPETEFEPTATVTAGNDSNQDLSPEQLKINQVQTAFKTHFDEHARRLQKLMADLGQAAQLDFVKSSDQLKAQIASVDQLSPRLADERKFFLNQTADLEQLLNGQDLDPLLVTIMKRDMQNLSRGEAVILSDLFDSVTEHQNQIKAFLAAMETHWGEWTPEPATHQIRFTTPAAQNAYELRMIPVQKSAQTVQANFRSWVNYKPPK